MTKKRFTDANAIRNLTNAQLDSMYRAANWMRQHEGDTETIRQFIKEFGDEIERRRQKSLSNYIEETDRWFDQIAETFLNDAEERTEFEPFLEAAFEQMMPGLDYLDFVDRSWIEEVQAEHDAEWMQVDKDYADETAFLNAQFLAQR